MYKYTLQNRSLNKLLELSYSIRKLEETKRDKRMIFIKKIKVFIAFFKSFEDEITNKRSFSTFSVVTTEDFPLIAIAFVKDILCISKNVYGFLMEN